jgi:hypothetical protein
MTIYMTIWGALVAVVAGLAIYRGVLLMPGHPSLHLKGNSENQSKLAHKKDVVERWGKVLTVVVAVYGLVLAIVLYRAWQENWVIQWLR